jgi:hypothetical protein
MSISHIAMIYAEMISFACPIGAAKGRPYRSHYSQLV